MLSASIMPFETATPQYRIEELPVPSGSIPSGNRRKGSGTRYFTRKRFKMPSLFESLPMEIQINLTKYLPDGLEVINLRKVSRTFYNIFSCHDLVAKAIVQHYPFSRESKFPHHQRTKAIYDKVARRSYTQPRRQMPSKEEYVDCCPIFCDDEEEVLVYRTAKQISTKGWSACLWDLREDKTVELRLVDGSAKVGGCYNENGELYESAVVRDVTCFKGRGVMVVHGHHIHDKFGNDKDARRGEYTGAELALGNFGIEVAPRRMKHAHTFIQIYSLQRSDFGQIISSFSFHGNTIFAHAACNRHFFVAYHGHSLFLFKFPKDTSGTPIASDQPLQRMVPILSSASPAIYTEQRFWSCTRCRRVINVDSQGKYFFLYSNTFPGGGNSSTVYVISSVDAQVVKTVELMESPSSSEWRRRNLNNAAIWEWRFENDIKPIYQGEDGEEVRLIWVGTYGTDGTRNYSVAVDELDANGKFTGDCSPVMVEWKIDTLNSHLQPEDPVDYSQPTVFYAPTEFNNEGGVLGLPKQALGWEELKVKHDIIKWPVGVNPYKSSKRSDPEISILRWGACTGARGYYTTDFSEMVPDSHRTVTLWYERSSNSKSDESVFAGETLLWPTWSSVLDNWPKFGGEDFRSPSVGKTAPRLLASRENTNQTAKQINKWENHKKRPADNTFFHEGTGWILYRIRKEGGASWRADDEEKKRLQENRAQCGLEANMRNILIPNCRERQDKFRVLESQKATSMLVYLKF